jgi:hypothetical protein
MPENRFKSSPKASPAYPIIEKAARTALLRRRHQFTANSGEKLQLRAGRGENMGKYSLTLWAMLAVTVAAAPAFAQEAPAAAKEKAKPTGTVSRPGGAASASYARCAPGNPIGGIIVKGGSNLTTGTAGTEGNCPSTGGTEAAEGKGRTYTGGRRNEDAPPAAVEATPAASGDMPSRLSMTPTTIKAVAPAATGLLKKKDDE